MKWIIFMLMLGGGGYAGYKALQNHPELQSKVEQFLPAGEFHTLEIRFSAEQIMETQRRTLLKSGRHKYLETSLRFYPYLLMEVKYAVSAKKTEEGLILWDLCDGEMVIETRGWEKTHGFGDCLTANVDRQEFKIVNFLAKKGGSSQRKLLQEALHLETPVLDSLMESLRRKQIVLLSNDLYRLHLEKPKLKTLPSTEMSERLVTKTWKQAQKVSKRYSLSQVIRLSKAAFGEDFAVKHTSHIYLPVHSIVVQNPDGSLHTSLWNALNGKEIFYSHAAD